jgi:hypothetical protein
MRKETDKNVRPARNRLGCILIAFVCGLGVSCATHVEVPINVPISAKLDLNRIDRVLVAGFATQTTEDLDLGVETTRLLRNQLRNGSNLHVVEADIEPLGDFSEEALRKTGKLDELDRMEEQARAAGEDDVSRQEWIDMEQDKLLHDDDYWRKLGEEYQEPLIISGKLRFASESRSGYAAAERYVRDSFGRPQRQRQNRFQERTGYVLSAELYFIDSSTGEAIHRERFTEEVIYGAEEQVSALASYFELMDRMIPSFMLVLSPQTFRGTRILLR